MASGVTSRRSGQSIDRAEDGGGATIAETCRHHRCEARPIVARSPHRFVGDCRQPALGMLDVAATSDRGAQPVDRGMEAIDDLDVGQVVETVGRDPRRDR